tara:strand:+ start:1930 stop:2583 length:654 start_codon:yes stop_codon:yes gene_type:complete
MKTLFAVLLGVTLLGTACNDPVTDITSDDLTLNQIKGLALEPLNEGETAALLFMREEEKLARDVYTYLFDKWSVKSFQNISNSEQTHMDAVLVLIDKYELEDPAADNIFGTFQNSDLQRLYDELTDTGSASMEAALKVGAAIEEIDIIDLQQALDISVDNQDITIVFENLMKGSRNHLRAFVSNLSTLGITYEPQYLTQDDYNAIINSQKETGGSWW